EHLSYLAKPFSARQLAERLMLTLHLEATSPHAQGDEDETSQRPPVVLIIDSDPCFLEWVELVLMRRNIPCHCAPDIVRALPLVDQHAPDVIFLSVDEPGTVTAQLVDTLRDAAQGDDVALYLMTGVPEGISGRWNATGLLKKPFAIDHMMGL